MALSLNETHLQQDVARNLKIPHRKGFDCSQENSSDDPIFIPQSTLKRSKGCVLWTYFIEGRLEKVSSQKIKHSFLDPENLSIYSRV